MLKNLHLLPRLEDSITYLYIEHAIIEQDSLSIVIMQDDGRVPVPVASTTCFLLGPGTKISHAAIKAICQNGCMAIWCGEGLGKFYASGLGETKSSENLLTQARLCMQEDLHMQVVRRMYERRFISIPDSCISLQQLRGMEGIRVRESYKTASKESGIEWNGRDYSTGSWDFSDPVNKALSIANSLLYSVCQASIVSLGYSPGLGFIHTGKQLSFVYDIADLYKVEMTIPVAFKAMKDCSGTNLEKNTRILCRDSFSRHKLLQRLPGDIRWVFGVDSKSSLPDVDVKVVSLWDADNQVVAGGQNYSDERGSYGSSDS
jgi:CRISPR-associated protein Cas1